MLATGGLMICAAALTLAAIGPLFRRNDPPRWTTYGWVGELVTLAIVCAFALGIGALGAGAIEAVQTGLDYLDLVLLAGVVAVAVAVRRWWQSGAGPAAPRAEPGLSVVASDATAGGRPAAPAGPARSSPRQPRRPRRVA